MSLNIDNTNASFIQLLDECVDRSKTSQLGVVDTYDLQDFLDSNNVSNQDVELRNKAYVIVDSIDDNGAAKMLISNFLSDNKIFREKEFTYGSDKQDFLPSHKSKKTGKENKSTSTNTAKKGNKQNKPKL